MTAFPKYPKYKASGVEWLGVVPEHWEVERLKGSLSEIDVRSTTGAETLLSLRMNVGLVPHNEVSTLPITNAQLVGYKKVAPGQVVMNRMRASSGIFAVATTHGLVSPDYAVFEPKGKQGTDYLLSLFKTGPMMTEFRRYSTGLGTGESGFLRLYSNFFFNIRCPIPPKEEENRIVAFLDEKTAEIDRLIAKKQRQIELLDEQKAILINRAVTRGLHPQAELQDSGIAWIGPIPKHWRVAPLYGRCEVRLGKMLDGSRITGRRLQPYLRNTDVQWFKINTDSLPMMDFSVSEYERYSVRRGDLLVCEGGEPGRAAIWESDALCFFQKALHRVRPIKGDHPRFLLYLFRNAVTQAAFSGFEKATIAHLTGEQLRRFRFAFPPIHEQQEIVAHLDELTSAFATATTKLESQIQTLQTLRSTLIAHAVTGKIKV